MPRSSSPCRKAATWAADVASRKSSRTSGQARRKRRITSWQPPVHRTADIAEADNPASPRSRVTGCRQRPPGLRHDLPGVIEERAACWRKADHAVAAFDEPGADLLLQPADRRRQWRLRHVQPGGGTAEVELFCDGDELTKLTDVDHRVRLPWLRERGAVQIGHLTQETSTGAWTHGSCQINRDCSRIGPIALSGQPWPDRP